MSANMVRWITEGGMSPAEKRNTASWASGEGDSDKGAWTRWNETVQEREVN